MEGMGWFFVAIVALPIIWAIGNAMTNVGLQKKFADLGQLKGQTKAEIVQAAGPPNAVSVMADGKELLQWQVAGYHIALLFTGEVCDGVTHEHATS